MWPRPPITNAVAPIAAAAACVVAAGRRPIRTTLRVAGRNAYTLSLAVPFSREPPAMTTRPAAAVTAAYRSVCGRCATTRALPPGLHATMVSSQRVLPV